jgi:hypothetical protein
VEPPIPSGDPDDQAHPVVNCAITLTIEAQQKPAAYMRNSFRTPAHKYSSTLQMVDNSGGNSNLNLWSPVCDTYWGEIMSLSHADNIGKVYWEANLSCAHTAKEIRMCHTRLGHEE